MADFLHAQGMRVGVVTARRGPDRPLLPGASATSWRLPPPICNELRAWIGRGDALEVAHVQEPDRHKAGFASAAVAASIGNVCRVHHAGSLLAVAPPAMPSVNAFGTWALFPWSRPSGMRRRSPAHPGSTTTATASGGYGPGLRSGIPWPPATKSGPTPSWASSASLQHSPGSRNGGSQYIHLLYHAWLDGHPSDIRRIQVGLEGIWCNDASFSVVLVTK